MSRSEQNSGTIGVREAHRFDVSRLARFMQQEVAGFASPLSVNAGSFGGLAAPGR